MASTQIHADVPRTQFTLWELFGAGVLASVVFWWVAVLHAEFSDWIYAWFLGYPAVHFAVVLFLTRYRTLGAGLFGAAPFCFVVFVFALCHPSVPLIAVPAGCLIWGPMGAAAGVSLSSFWNGYRAGMWASVVLGLPWIAACGVALYPRIQ